MAELPGFVWIAIGIFIGVVSLFLGFLKPVQNNVFFQMMMFVGIGMIGWGYFKSKRGQKTPQQMIEERRRQRPMEQREVEIDIDDYRKNPQLRQQTAQPSTQQAHHQHTHKPTSGGAQHTQHKSSQHQPTQHAAKHQAHKTGYCTQCGTPLLKKHKFCPICGAKV